MAIRKSRSPEIIILSDSSDERKRTSKRPETINISSSSSNTKRLRASHQAASSKAASPRATSPRATSPRAAEEITLKSQTNYLRQTGNHEQMEDFEDIDDEGGCFYILERHHSGLVLNCGSVLIESTRSNVLHFNMKFIFQDGQWISNKGVIHKGNIDSVFKCEFIGRGSAPAPNSVRTYASQTHPGVMNSFLYPPPIQVFKKPVAKPPSPKRSTIKPPSPKRAEATRKRERPFPSSFNFDSIDPTVQRYFDMDLTVATQDEHNRLRKATAGIRHAISERFSEWVFDWVYYKAKRKDFNIDLDDGGDINYDITLENIINVACDEIRKPHKKKIWLEELIEFLYHKSYWARKDRDFLYSPINHFFKISHYEAESWGEADPGSYGPSQAATTRAPDIDGAYRILGIAPGSPFDVAKQAYKKLALKHHPDKGGDPEKFKELNEAWSNIQSSFE